MFLYSYFLPLYSIKLGLLETASISFLSPPSSKLDAAAGDDAHAQAPQLFSGISLGCSAALQSLQSGLQSSIRTDCPAVFQASSDPTYHSNPSKMIVPILSATLKSLCGTTTPKCSNHFTTLIDTLKSPECIKDSMKIKASNGTLLSVPMSEYTIMVQTALDEVCIKTADGKGYCSVSLLVALEPKLSTLSPNDFGLRNVEQTSNAVMQLLRDSHNDVFCSDCRYRQIQLDQKQIGGIANFAEIVEVNFRNFTRECGNDVQAYKVLEGKDGLEATVSNGAASLGFVGMWNGQVVMAMMMTMMMTMMMML